MAESLRSFFAFIIALIGSVILYYVLDKSLSWSNRVWGPHWFIVSISFKGIVLLGTVSGANIILDYLGGNYTSDNPSKALHIFLGLFFISIGILIFYTMSGPIDMTWWESCKIYIEGIMYILMGILTPFLRKD